MLDGAWQRAGLMESGGKIEPLPLWDLQQGNVKQEQESAESDLGRVDESRRLVLCGRFAS